MKLGKREIRRIARGSVYALLDANLDAGDGDLWIMTDGWTEADRAEFTAEVRRIMDRLSS